VHLAAGTGAAPGCGGAAGCVVVVHPAPARRTDADTSVQNRLIAADYL
jgi:hypothetical protein